MKNFQSVIDLFSYLNRLSVSNNKVEMVNIDDDLSPESLLFTATKELKLSNHSLYGQIIEKATILPLEKTQILIAAHLYFTPNYALLQSLIHDIGNFEISAIWGVSEAKDMAPKIYTWHYQGLQISLRRDFHSVIDYVILPPNDVVTISTDIFEAVRFSK